ncbi:peptide chain release factor N(5)-glutamine methyltransferase [Loktanella sp. IMCC34160]|uniref:peptide chain release factor N(5)-glutamine methyltransferase n=1 Tax=Loktanella sp. IMCC34160 TaxID=2510646 RepID=UPI00101DCC14|nr:peptide chain release factor N(5)-glutamine methyltransferase [Loktanella sp. IMCC34160]RYG93202.1 peptide chain release factor N(5)-glutamine methyltransferase [Loktanella sp. IMCC34160]
MNLTVQDGLTALTAKLAAGGIDGAGREARLILSHILDTTPDRMSLIARDPLASDLLDRALGLATRRAGGTPMSHILGHRDFWGRRFEVTADVLDPRPETETLIAAALAVPFASVLDLGTGSGCILLTLLAERLPARGLGADLSDAALAVARRNAAALGVADRARLIRSDWFAEISGSFDLIVSNPPYIAAEEMPALAPELSFEPRMALTDERDGLTAYRAITAGAGAHLTPGGRLMVEIGWQQGAAVAELFQQAGLSGVQILPDLDGRDRVVSGQHPG